MLPKRTIIVSNNCPTFSTKPGVGFKFSASTICFTFSLKTLFSILLTTVFGNKSVIISKNNSISTSKNLGKFESFIARIRTSASGSLGNFSFKYPALVKIDLIPLKPKS